MVYSTLKIKKKKGEYGKKAVKCAEPQDVRDGNLRHRGTFDSKLHV